MRAKAVRGRQRADQQRLVAGAHVRIEHAVAVDERPAVEAAGDDAVQFAGRKVVAEQVAAVVGGEQLAAPRRPVETDAVAQSRGVVLHRGAVGTQAQHRGAPRVFFGADVAARTDRHVEPAVGTEAHRAAPVVTARRQAGQDAFIGTAHRAAGRIEGDPAHRGALADVEPAITDIQPVRAIEVVEQHLAALGRAVAIGVAPEQQHLAQAGLAHQQVAARRGTQKARFRHVSGVKIQPEPLAHREQLTDGRRARLRTLRAGHRVQHHAPVGDLEVRRQHQHRRDQGSREHQQRDRAPGQDQQGTDGHVSAPAVCRDSSRPRRGRAAGLCYSKRRSTIRTPTDGNR